MSPSQATVLDTLCRLTAACGIPPTYREIADALGHNTMTVVRHLRRLERKGLVTRRPNRARTVAATEAGRVALGEARA